MRKLQFQRIVGVVAFLLLVCAGVRAETPFYVAPGGDDKGTGALDSPFATLERARDAIRAMKKAGPLPAGGVTVWLQAGTYPLTASLALTAEDSGTIDRPIVYRAAKGADVWLSGAVRRGSLPIA